jgi:hypothetical protein
VNTTPLWVPLVVAAIGLLGTVGTIAGVLFTQRRAARREGLAWQRERQRERERWAREDALRTFEQRRDAYVGFYETLRATVRAVYDHGMGLCDPSAEEDDGELPFEWHEGVAGKLDYLRIYASPEWLCQPELAPG